MTVPSFLTINMSASWEAEKQSSHVVTRYCSFKIVQIILEVNIDNDPNLNAIFIAVRMGNASRKILRSSEISFSTDNSQKTSKYFINIDLNCNIIYSHSLKRDCNILQILVQRKKKYKNKTVLGYKSLGFCNIDLNQVLQRNLDNRFLDLYSDIKSLDRSVGQVEIQHLFSTPYNKIMKNKRKTSNNIMNESSFDDIDENQDPLSEDSESEEDHLTETNARNKNNLINVVANRELGTEVDTNDLLKKFDEIPMSEADEDYPNEDDLSGEDNVFNLDFFNRPNITRKQLKNLLYGNHANDGPSPTNSSLSLEIVPRPVLRPYLGPKNSFLHNLSHSSDETLSADSGARLLKRFFDSDIQSSKNINGALLDNDFMHDSKSSLALKLSPEEQLYKNNGDSHMVPEEKLSTEQPRETTTSNGKATIPEYISSDTNSDEGYNKEADAANPIRSDPPPLIHSANLTSRPTPLNRSSTTIIDQQQSPTATEPLLLLKKHRSLRSVEAKATTTPTSPLYKLDEVNVFPSTPLAHSSFTIPKFTNELNRETIENTNEFIDDAELMPDEIFIISSIEQSGKRLLTLAMRAKSEDTRVAFFSVGSIADANYVIGHLVGRLQSTKLRMPYQPIKICILGNDLILHTVLRAYVNQLSGKPSEFSTIFRFYLVPITYLDSCLETFHLTVSEDYLDSINIEMHQPKYLESNVKTYPNAYYWTINETARLEYFHDYNAEINSLACNLCRVDPIYSMIFSDYLIPPEIRTPSNTLRPPEISCLNIFDRIMLYLNHSKYLLNLAISECLIGIGEKTVNFTASTSATSSSAAGQNSSRPTSASSTIDNNPAAIVKNSHVCVENKAADDMLVPFLLHVSLGSDPVSALLSKHLPQVANFQDSEMEMCNQRLSLANPSPSFVTTQTSHYSSSIQGLPIIDSATNVTSSNRTVEDLKSFLFDIQLECILSLDHNSAHNKSGVSLNLTGQNQASIEKRFANKFCTRGLKIISASLVNALKFSLLYDGCLPEISPVNTRHALIQGVSKSSHNQNLVITMANKEKKQKISLLNKKSKDSTEYRHEFMTNINRIVCSGRRNQSITQNSVITINNFNEENTQKIGDKKDFDNNVNLKTGGLTNNYLIIKIDGVEFSNVKFFQINPTWRTHIKHFPLSTFVQGINFPVEISKKIKPHCSHVHKPVHQNLNFSKKMQDSPKIHH